MIFLALIDSEEGRDKFEALYEKYRDRLFSQINKIINDEHLSEDILQETFIKIANNIDNVNDDIDSTEAKAYIMTIAKNTAFDFYRKNAKRREVEVFVEEIDEAVFYDADEDSDSNTDMESRLASAILSMKDRYRDIFVLKYFNGLENDEIAKALNISEENVRKRISRGKKMLEKKLEGMGTSNGTN